MESRFFTPSLRFPAPAFTLFCLLVAMGVFSQPLHAETERSKGIVILLHGLARSSASMNRMQEALERDNFRTCNIDYPSTRHIVADLAADYVLPEIEECTKGNSLPLNFVTHSLGGIIVRYLIQEGMITDVGRVVMLSPPNRGSEVVDVLGDTWLFDWINGPAGKQLGTADNSLPLLLGPARFDLGIIAGNKSINLINSAIIDGADDGKVSVENAKLDGMNDFLVLPLTHPFIMKDATAIQQTIHFLNSGAFLDERR